MKFHVQWHYVVPKTTSSIIFTSPQLTLDEVLIVTQDLQKTGRTKQFVITDEHDSTWTLKELRAYKEELAGEPHDVVVYFDGGFTDEQAGLGIVIYYSTEQNMRLRQNTLLTHITSNNEAEYAALYEALRAVQQLGVSRQTITVRGDSQVVISQMRGDWPVYEKTLEYWATKIDTLIEQLQLTVMYEHIARAHNREAHQLATQALAKTSIQANAPYTSKRQKRRQHND